MKAQQYRWGDPSKIPAAEIFEHAKECLADPEFPADLRPVLQRIVDEQEADDAAFVIAFAPLWLDEDGDLA